MYNERGIPMSDEFFRILKEHATRYPQMKPQDYGKLVFQSEYGPEHLVTEKQPMISFLKEEMAELPSDTVPKDIELIGGGLCRFPLSFCKSEAEVRLLADLFLLTAQEHSGSAEGIRNKTEELKKLHISGMEEWLKDWEKNGYPPVHHSQSYRESYHPHYRLLKRAYAGYFPVVAAVRKRMPFGAVSEGMEKGEPVIIGIDGRCGSGKSSLSDLFSKLFDCNIFHMDDFYLPLERRLENWREIPGGNMDFERLISEVLEPIQKNQPVLYRPYDCQKGAIAESSKRSPKLLNIIEGSYSHHPQLRGNYRFTIFLTCSGAEQRRRLQEREGSYFSAFEKQWIPYEEHYYQCYDIEKNSDLNLDTSVFIL